MTSIPEGANVAFSSIIQQPLQQTNAIIDRLKAIHASNDEPYFSEISNSLPGATILFDTSEMKTGVFKYKDSVVNVAHISDGTYGKIFSGSNGNVYKMIKIRSTDKKYERFCREIYVEAYIQTVLQSDPDYGKNIGKLIRIYRDSNMTKILERKTQSSTIVTQRKTSVDYHFYLEMENIPIKLIDHINDLYIDNNTMRLSIEHIEPIYSQLIKLLQYFFLKYNFYHCDLHCNNVMMLEDGTIKIIDFGRSCINMKGHIYSTFNEPCFSYDIMIFLSSLHYLIGNKLDDTVRSFYYASMIDETINYNLFEKLYNDSKITKHPLHFYFYIDHINGSYQYPFWKTEYPVFETTVLPQRFYILNFAEYYKSFLDHVRNQTAGFIENGAKASYKKKRRTLRQKTKQNRKTKHNRRS